jgi:hypothetical protein
LKAVNPHAKSQEDTRTPEELLDLIEAKGKAVAENQGVGRRPVARGVSIKRGGEIILRCKVKR